MHVHVGLDDPDKAIHVANGMRVHMPVLLGLSANSPFWRAEHDRPGLDAHADLPRLPAGRDPAPYEDWADYERRIEFMIKAGVIEDYTYLWHDVRPHPKFGTVEIRVMDSQTHIEHSLGLAALVQAMVARARRALRRRQQAVALPVRDARREQVAGRPARPGGRARRPAQLRAGRHAGAGPAADRPHARALR